jgi:hypothetical protein
MVNVIVRPDVFDRCRVAVRGEPFLWVRGKLAKDEGSVNVIAEQVRGLVAERGTRNVERGTEERADDALDRSAFRAPSSAFAFLRSFRRVAPGSKDWG